MKKVIWYFLFLATIALGKPEQNDSLFFIGEFDDYEFTEEHQSGFGLVIWGNEKNIVGLFFHSAGLIGDTPRGKLIDGKFDFKTGDLEFKAKLTEGISGPEEAPSKDFYKFKGVMRKKAIVGYYDYIDSSSASPFWTSGEVTLKKSVDGFYSPMDKFKSIAEWEEKLKRTILFHGPKW